jgi:3-hydroxymyristoyl/3-hydroxydecanoyl-(acyl carrier protein) dehydratase
VTIATDHAAFDGHFPGEPIFPGVAQIGLVLDALRDACGRRLQIVAIPSLRWRSPVRPGDCLDLRVQGPDTEGRLSFELRRGAEVVSHGTLAVSAARTP